MAPRGFSRSMLVFKGGKDHIGLTSRSLQTTLTSKTHGNTSLETCCQLDWCSSVMWSVFPLKTCVGSPASFLMLLQNDIAFAQAWNHQSIYTWIRWASLSLFTHVHQHLCHGRKVSPPAVPPAQVAVDYLHHAPQH